MSYLFIILTGLIAGTTSFLVIERKQFKDFHQFAKEGDLCNYILKGKSYRGTIDSYTPERMYSYVKDKDGITHRVFSADISPVLTYNYKSWR